MSGDQKKLPAARETEGEGAVPRQRKEGGVPADQRAEPKRGEETADGRLIERQRDAHNPEGL